MQPRHKSFSLGPHVFSSYAASIHVDGEPLVGSGILEGLET